MKLALIAPPNALGLVSKFFLGYHLVLAQHVTRGSAYYGAYKKSQELGHFIILDNGAAEMGKSMKMEDLLDVAEHLDPDEIILPDSLDDAEDTIRLTKGSFWRVPRHMRAVVPQGRDWNEWTYCLEELVKLGCSTICVAKRYEALPGGRAEALAIIQKHRYEWDHHIHLLGCYKRPLFEIREAHKSYEYVRGIDTGAPIAYAQAGMTFDSSERASLDWGGRYDPILAEENIKRLIAACKGEHYARDIEEPSYRRD